MVSDDENMHMEITEQCDSLLHPFVVGFPGRSLSAFLCHWLYSSPVFPTVVKVYKCFTSVRAARPQ